MWAGNRTTLPFLWGLLNKHRGEMSLLSRSVRRYSILFGKACKPKDPNSRYPGGEDALLVSPVDDNKTLLAVADGVGGWRESGIDPSLFPNQLMTCLKNAIPSYSGRPAEMVKKAYRELVELNYTEKIDTPGSCTICVSVIDAKALTLQSFNLGDSGVIVLRKKEDNYRILYQSELQESDFNTPLTLQLYPSRRKDNKVLLDDTDPTAKAELKKLKLKSGDCVVLATDGVFDNLYPKDIVSVVKEYIMNENRAQNTADGILSLAYSASIKKGYISPFTVRAKTVNWNRPGGKTDDIAVVVAIVL